MKAIRLHQYGGAESLVYEDAPQPQVLENQVLIEVYATSVNHLEVMMASGDYKDSMPVEFPWIPGFDFAGRIDYVGSQVVGFKKGDEVYGKASGGSYAEYIVVDMGAFDFMPANLSFAEASSVPHVGLTAWQAVFEYGKIESGQTVLIHGASGAVGAFAVQFAKNAGGVIYANDNGVNTQYLKSIGADVVIDYKTENFVDILQDVDLVLDFVGKDTPQKSYPIMKNGGRLVSTVAQLSETDGQEYGITTIYMGVKPDYENLKEISKLIKEEKVKTDIAEIFPISQTRRAWLEYSHQIKPEKEYTHGKIILQVK